MWKATSFSHFFVSKQYYIPVGELSIGVSLSSFFPTLIFTSHELTAEVTLVSARTFQTTFDLHIQVVFACKVAF